MITSPQTPHSVDPGDSWPDAVTDDGLARIRTARERAVGWLTEHVADDGTPSGAELGMGWWRGPWALALGGAPDTASALLGWAERTALTDEGDLREGPYGGGGASSPVYFLSALAIGGWLLGRYDLAGVINRQMDHFTDPASGGAYEHRDFAADPQQDVLKTGQLGISSLVCGRREHSERIYRWLRRQWEAQPEPGCLYSSWRGDGIVTDVSGMQRWLYVADYSKERQTYFNPGIAAAFLAGYAQQTQDRAALDLARSYLSLNVEGTPAQFDDPGQVQICKFGWGAASVLAADPASGMLPWTVRMGEWFVRRQAADGSWAPSAFLVAQPTVVDLFQKTSEHLMELIYIEIALQASAAARG
ncbi:hypothetical protein [Rhodococcus opacus]|uniref:Uncharacterized protein n=1 Tax=Rhodococcus opacus TaxID=37919 RepID=A0A2S8J4Q1_RHOOP|nr:hypothetical protein [Rhodococcus opacus]PQP21947.1 hypothetical protein C5613_24730 [Rhodococcus opacus]